MKNLVFHSLNARDCRKEWQEFDALLKSKSVLDERKDILPFFKQRHNLSILICTYFPQIKKLKLLFPINFFFPIYPEIDLSWFT